MSHFGLRSKRLLLIAGDAAIYQLCLVLTLWMRYGRLDPVEWRLHAPPFALVTVLWILGSYVAGLYDPALTKNGVKFFRMYLESMIANLGIALAFFYLLPFFGIEPRTNLLLYFSLALLLGYAWRSAYNRWVNARLFKNRILFIGTPTEAAQTQATLEKTALGFELAAVLQTADGTRFETPAIRWETSPGQLERMINEEKITILVVGPHPDQIPGLQEALFRSLFLPITLVDRTALEETLTGRIPLEYVSETWFLEHLQEHEKTWYETAKRCIDIFLAIPFGLFTLLILPFVAAAIKLSSPGPVFYAQVRVGRGGSSIKIFKFRSMHTDAEKDGPVFTASAKTDPRLFRIGRIMRMLRLDELPQIWNVLRGDLSFIGPRPERPEFVAPLIQRVPHYALRHLTRPGLTGWAQVRFLTPTASLEDNLVKLQYDLYYVKNRSLLLDGAIFLKTIGIVLRRQGT